ncbi:MAG: hypothetical protein M1831_003716 [Alyxoria varia]|nr:MAG: hypothetical protein M1831_003716 [Alyxoria varia]
MVVLEAQQSQISAPVKETSISQDQETREKIRHREQHPDYRYQPRRHKKNKSSLGESPTSATSVRCDNCGGWSMPSPSSAATTSPIQPIQPSAAAPASAPIMNNNRQLPVVNNLSLASPTRRSSTRHYPTNINIPPIAQDSEMPEDRMDISPPKRRRFTNGAYVPIPPQVQAANAYTMRSPYRESFGHPDAHRRWQAQAQAQSMVAGPRSAVQPPPTGRVDGSLTLPPLQPQTDRRSIDSGRSLEEIIMNMDPLIKMKVLGRISPPFKGAKTSSSSDTVRGAVIAVEGDNQGVVNAVVRWLEEYLGRGKELSVKTAKGPGAPETGKTILLLDYLHLIHDWHNKSKEMIETITKPVEAPEEPQPDKDDDDKDAATTTAATSTTRSRIPVVILQHYQLFTCNSWACRIQVEDAYGAPEHWQWIATLWRGIIGPDITIYVKDANAEEMAKEKDVELREDIRAIVVRREKGPGPLQGDVEDKSLRRLGFEVGEWIRSVSRPRDV